MPIYSVYGLKLQANCNLPGLTSLSNSTDNQSDVQVYFQYMPECLSSYPLTALEEWYLSSYYDEDGQPTSRVWKTSDGRFFLLKYSDGTQFLLDSQGTQVWTIWPDNLTLENTVVYLLGPILGYVLRLRNIICLHASCVVINGQAVAFVGDSGAGKSTTAAAFAKLGYPVLSDDVVALVYQNDQFLVQPAYPCIRLWSESVENLFGSPVALPRLVPDDPTWDKRYLDLRQPQYHFQQEAVPLAALYLLGERQDSLDAPFVKEVPHQLKLVSLVANTYANYLLDKNLRAHEFETLGRLLKAVPVRELVPNSNIASLNRLCEVVMHDFKALADGILV